MARYYIDDVRITAVGDFYGDSLFFLVRHCMCEEEEEKEEEVGTRRFFVLRIKGARMQGWR